MPGRRLSPYAIRTLFAAAPAHTYFPSVNVTLVFPDALFTRYQLEQPGQELVQSLEVDFGDGQGYVPAGFDQPIGTTYASAGAKQVKVRYTYQYVPAYT